MAKLTNRRVLRSQVRLAFIWETHEPDPNHTQAMGSCHELAKNTPQQGLIFKSLGLL